MKKHLSFLCGISCLLLTISCQNQKSDTAKEVVIEHAAGEVEPMDGYVGTKDVFAPFDQYTNEFPEPIVGAALSPTQNNNKYMVYVSAGLVLKKWDFKNNPTELMDRVLPHVAFSPDGKKLVMSQTINQFESNQIVEYDVETGKSEELTHNFDSDDNMPVYTTDGKYVIFVSGRTGYASLYKMERTSKKIVQLTNVGMQRKAGGGLPEGYIPPPMDYKSITIDGNKIAYFDGDENWEVDINTGDAKKVSSQNSDTQL